MKTLILICLSLFFLGCTSSSDSTAPGNPLVPHYPVPNSSTENLKVGAFNIQIFGVSKMNNANVVTRLKQIIPRYDLLLIQEIRDASGNAIQSLLTQLNAANGNKYAMVLGSRVGRTSSKEQYAFLYDKNKLSVEDSFEYDDGVEPNNDTFEREPLLVLFKVITTGDKFFTIGIHTKPEDAVNEIDELDSVFVNATTYWNNSAGIILGDFNADCSYVSDNAFLNLILYQDTSLNWLFPKTGDSTVSSTTTCQYDQIVVSNVLNSKVVSGSAKVYNFQTELGLTNTEASDVSDHFPVEMDLVF